MSPVMKAVMIQQYRGSTSYVNKAFTDTRDEHLQVISTESTYSCTGGDNEEPAPWCELRPQKENQCRPPAKHSHCGHTSDEDNKALASLILSTKSQMDFVFYVIQVHIILLEHKPGLFELFWWQNSGANIGGHICLSKVQEREQRKVLAFYEKASRQVTSVCIHRWPHFAWNSWCLKKAWNTAKATSSLSSTRPTDLPAHWAC